MDGPSNSQHSLDDVLAPVTLPCGATLPNRLVKAALCEHLASLFGGPPNPSHLALYSRWASGSWGMIISGNVQVSPHHLTLGRDIVLPPTITETSLRPFTQLAQAIHGFSSQPRSLAVMQLSHAGRQSPLLLGGRLPFVPASAPSPVPLGRQSQHDGWLARTFYRLMFQTPRQMSPEDIEATIEDFVRGATVALAAGFDGLELHASHGYLLAQFISPKSNTRDDAYGDPLYVLHRIVTAVRAAVPTKFVLGIKISSADFVEAGTSTLKQEHAEDVEKRALAHITHIARWGIVDFLEISGGDYESPDFMVTARQVFFSRFSRLVRTAIREIPRETRPLVLLTGGLRTRANLCDAVSLGHADLLGIGRGSVLCPDLPRRMTSSAFSPDDELYIPPNLDYPDSRVTRIGSRVLHRLGVLPLPKLIGAGVGMAWYVVMLRRIGRGKGIDRDLGGLGAVLWMWDSELRVVGLVMVCVVSWAWWMWL